jgi:hypothetical protein
VVAASLPVLAAYDPLRRFLELAAANAGGPEEMSPRNLFHEIRQFSQLQHVDGVRSEVVRLAELACKVIHNATGGTRPLTATAGSGSSRRPQPSLGSSLT